MIAQLLAIKRRREQGIRRDLAKTTAEIQGCAQRLEGLKARQASVRTQWQEAVTQAGVLNSKGLSILRATLNRFENEDKRIFAEINAVNEDQMRLTHLHKEQEWQLRLILREQEKLKLLEDSQ